MGKGFLSSKKTPKQTGSSVSWLLDRDVRVEQLSKPK